MAKCQKLNQGEACQNEGGKCPVLELRVTAGGPAISVQFGVHHCDEHAAKAQISDFINDAGWLEITESIRRAGKATPVRELTIMTWIDFTGSPLEQIKARERHQLN